MGDLGSDLWAVYILLLRAASVERHIGSLVSRLGKFVVGLVGPAVSRVGISIGKAMVGLGRLYDRNIDRSVRSRLGKRRCLSRNHCVLFGDSRGRLRRDWNEARGASFWESVDHGSFAVLGWIDAGGCRQPLLGCFLERLRLGGGGSNGLSVDPVCDRVYGLESANRAVQRQCALGVSLYDPDVRCDRVGGLSKDRIDWYRNSRRG